MTTAVSTLGRAVRGTGRVVLWMALVGLLYPAAGLTAVRLLQSESGTAIRLESFTPFALPLYAGALVLLVVATARRGRERRTPWLVATGLALAGVVLHGWWLAPAYVGGAPPAAAGTEPLVVMTSNLFEGRGDVDTLLGAVREEGVEVLVLAEISTQALADADAAGLADLLPYRIGGPRGDDPVSGTMVLADQPLGVATAVETYHDSWVVDVGTGASAVRVMAVHPVAPVTPAQWVIDHAIILAAAEELEPDLVLGDFNATNDHAPMQALDDGGWRDGAELADSGWQPTWPANGLTPVQGLSLPPLVQIDHVLVGPSMTALSTRTVEIPASDHLALVAEVARR